MCLGTVVGAQYVWVQWYRAGYEVQLLNEVLWYLT